MIVQAKMLGDALRVLADLARLGIALFGHVTGFFQQRKVNIGFDITGRTRVTIPIPGTTNIAASLYDADLLNASFTHAGCGHKAAKATTNYQHIQFIVDRFATLRVSIRIIQHFPKALAHVEIGTSCLVGSAAFALSAITLA